MVNMCALIPPVLPQIHRPHHLEIKMWRMLQLVSRRHHVNPGDSKRYCQHQRQPDDFSFQHVRNPFLFFMMITPLHNLANRQFCLVLASWASSEKEIDASGVRHNKMHRMPCLYPSICNPYFSVANSFTTAAIFFSPVL